MMIDDDNYDNELNEFIQDDEVDERLLPDSDEDIIALMDDNEVMEEIIERLTKERDEARREVCELQAHEANRLSSAVRLKGWICFEETT